MTAFGWYGQGCLYYQAPPQGRSEIGPYKSQGVEVFVFLYKSR
jgi:hypothetical protein